MEHVINGKRVLTTSLKAKTSLLGSYRTTVTQGGVTLMQVTCDHEDIARSEHVDACSLARRSY